MHHSQSETIGTLELRIARLRSQLQILKSQVKMSRAYPDRHQALRQTAAKVRKQLKRLTQKAGK